MKRLALLALAACGDVKISATMKPSSTGQLAADCDVALVPHGPLVFAFDREKASILRGEQIVRRADPPPSAHWDAATALLGPDGQRWIVGLAGDALWRVTSSGELEPLADRLGLGGTRVLAIDAVGSTFAIGLAGGVAISRDGAHVMRFAGEDVPFVAAANGRVALGRPRSVEIYDLDHGTRSSYAVKDVSAVGFLDAASAIPRLIVTSGEAVYVEQAGTLHRVPMPAVRQMAISGGRAWLLGRSQLLTFDGTKPARVDVEVPDGAHVFPGGVGGVWLTGAHQLQRLVLDAGTRRTDWSAHVAPVFKRVCSDCHEADGEAELDLSTPDAWLLHSDEIRDALATHAMPPPGSELTDADRHALEQWLAP